MVYVETQKAVGVYEQCWRITRRRFLCTDLAMSNHSDSAFSGNSYNAWNWTNTQPPSIYDQDKTPARI